MSWSVVRRTPPVPLVTASSDDVLGGGRCATASASGYTPPVTAYGRRSVAPGEADGPPAAALIGRDLKPAPGSARRERLSARSGRGTGRQLFTHELTDELVERLRKVAERAAGLRPMPYVTKLR
jgi:hypothetical protein